MKEEILIIMPALPGGGAEKVLVDILCHFDYKLYNVTLFLEYRDGLYLSDIPNSVKIISLHGRCTIWFERWHRLLRILHCFVLFHSVVYKLMFLFKLRGLKYDITISFMEGSAVKFHSYILAKAKKNISWIHIDFKRKHWSLEFFRNGCEENRVYKKMDKIVFVSEGARQGFLQMYKNLDEEKCLVLYNIIDREEIIHQAESRIVAKNKFTVCMVGRLNEQKRYDRALRVALRLKKDGYDLDFWILGTGICEKELKRINKENGTEDMFHFLGFVKPSYAYMKTADIFLNTSEAEGYPLVICEALCLAKPIVATNITGTDEILDSSKYGLLVSEDDEGIYKGLKQMIDNQDLRNKYAEEALIRSEIFTVDKTMKEIYKLI